MVADEQSGIREIAAQSDRAFDNGGRLRATIDQVAEQDNGDLGRGPRGDIGADLVDQFGKEVVTPVDIANGVHTPAARHRKTAAHGVCRLALTLPEHSKTDPTSNYGMAPFRNGEPENDSSP